MKYGIAIILNYTVEAETEEEARALATHNVFTSHVEYGVELNDVYVDDIYEVR